MITPDFVKNVVDTYDNERRRYENLLMVVESIVEVRIKAKSTIDVRNGYWFQTRSVKDGFDVDVMEPFWLPFDEPEIAFTAHVSFDEVADTLTRIQKLSSP